MGEVVQFRAFAFADLLTSGKVGEELTAELRAYFADISRTDVFLGVRLAVSIFQADILEAQLERDIIKVERDSARLDLDAAEIRAGYLERQRQVMNSEGSWLKIGRMPDPAMGAAHG
jgi:hypothetical protein